MHEPTFWRAAPGGGGWGRALAQPLAWLYQTGAQIRAGLARPRRAGPPVVCVGGATLGGAGKTPVALSLLEAFRAAGLEAHAATRGYGGRLRGPVQVDAMAHTAAQVGDEALLLAHVAQTWVSKNRFAGVRAAAEAGAELVVLDDGLQNPNVAKDFALLVIDGEDPDGNGATFPAGPLRAPWPRAAARSDAIVVIGGDQGAIAGLQAKIGAAGADKPWLYATLEPFAPPPDRPVLAFAGLARPSKFFTALERAGAEVAERAAFADHHQYADTDLAALAERARTLDAQLITTAKDAVRLPAAWRPHVAVFNVAARFEEADALPGLLERIAEAAAA
ncbi:MAG: tetraacyldisaccharide 4'-kinase [Maricaulaceae bacterium]